METVLYIGVFLCVYGLLGVCGCKIAIPKQFKGKKWEKEFSKKHGITWVICGVAELIFYITLRNRGLSIIYVIVLFFIFTIPSIIYYVLLKKKYENN